MSKLATLRKATSQTQQQLADRAGVPVTTISRLECGKRPVSGVSLRIAIAIADALNVSDLRGLI